MLLLDCKTTASGKGIYNRSSASRRVGRSIIHDASSRTHAMVDLAPVHAEILTLEQRIEDKHGAFVEISDHKDDVLRDTIEEAYKRDGGLVAVVDGVPLTKRA
jgi:hypothetical protein